jgi:hypothetical protein
LAFLRAGQLAVGTVFSRYLNMFIDNPLPPPEPPIIPDPVNNPLSWDRVDAWVKFRLGAANINMFDNVFFSINDNSVPPNVVGLNSPPRDWLANIGAPGLWFVAHAYKIAFWEEWESTNLRAVLSIQGTSNPANVGPVSVDVEWFAFRLSVEIPPHE